MRHPPLDPRGWEAALAGSRGRGPLPPLRGASLLLLDLQRLFVDPVSPAFVSDWTEAGPRCAALLAAFRARGLPVIWTRHLNPPGDDGGAAVRFGGRPLRAGDPLSALAEGWTPLPGEPVLCKARYSPWVGTGLAQLVPPGAALLIAGVTTHRCVLAAALEAATLDRVALVAADACATRDGELHLSALRCLAAGLAHVASTAELLDALA